MVIKRLKYFILLFSFIVYPSFNLSIGILDTLWQHCTFNKAMTALNIGTNLYTLSESVQLQAYTEKTYTNLDGSSQEYNEEEKEASQKIKDNIQRIAQELKIDINDLKIKKMTNPQKCITTLGIEATRNFIFVQEKMVLVRSKDVDPSYDIIIPLFDFSKQDDRAVTFLIRQALLKWKQSFYTKRICHKIGLSLANGFIVSSLHNLCANTASNMVNPTFNHAWAQWGWDRAKSMASISLSLSLVGLSYYFIRKWKSAVGDSVYYDIVQKTAENMKIYELQEALKKAKESCNKGDIRYGLIEKQKAILSQIVWNGWRALEKTKNLK